MASLRVFVSSTCYDLSAIRSQIRSFIFSMGYEPIMSDYNDILYDPRIHTHTSCIEEVNTCDLIILVVGSRFGGRAIPEALLKLDFEQVFDKSKSVDSLKKKENISVTQLEILKAVELDIPIFTFIDNRLWNDHELYEKNKGKILQIFNKDSDNTIAENDIIKLIDFPSIDKPETAEFIFEFINFLRHRTKGNSINQFTKFEDIESTLKKQWSGLFQRLLNENRLKTIESKRIDGLSSQFEDLKTAILTSISNTSDRDVAKGVVKYRKLYEFIRGLLISDFAFLFQQEKVSWSSFFNDTAGIKEVIDLESDPDVINRMLRARTILLKEDYTFFEVRSNVELINDMEFDFNSFMRLEAETREIIFEALDEMPQTSMLIRYRNINFERYLYKIKEEGLDKI